MRKWLLLLAAILLEVAATLSLRAALDNPGWYALVFAGYVGSFVVLSFVLRTGMALGVAYGIWGASGVALTAVLATFLFDDPLTAAMGAGTGLIIAGVLCVELGSHGAPTQQEGAH
jgi:small multidrug resistance pump